MKTSLVQVNWNPTDRQLRQFGVIGLFAFPLVAWIWAGGDSTTVGVFSAIGLIAAGLGMFCPVALKPVFLLLTLLVLPVGMLISEVTLLLVYFAVFLPIGLALKLVRRDPLQLLFDKHAQTYWQTKKRPSGLQSYFRQS